MNATVKYRRSMKTLKGNLIVKESMSVDYEKIEGYIKIFPGATLDAPLLETVGGDVYVSGKLDAPNLEIVGGYVYVYGKLDAPKLEAVGRDVSVYSNATLDAPKLKNKNIGINELNKILAKKGLILADGILSRILRSRGGVFLTKRVGSDKKEYLVTDGEYFSHGATLKEAKSDLKYKRSSRDTSQFKKWSLDTEVSIDDAILAYRSITGACMSGVRSFCSNLKLPKKITVSEIIDQTRGQYKNER